MTEDDVYLDLERMNKPPMTAEEFAAHDRRRELRSANEDGYLCLRLGGKEAECPNFPDSDMVTAWRDGWMERDNEEAARSHGLF